MLSSPTLNKKTAAILLDPDNSTLSYAERSAFRKWRLQILIAGILGYASYYIVRQNFSLSMPALIEEFGFTKTQLGGAMMAFSIIYAVGKLVNGFISDRSNARYFMPAGLAISALLSLCMGLSTNILSFIALYALMGWFQSMGWPPMARMLTHWFTPKELGLKWAIASAAHQVGGAAIYAVGPLLIISFGWKGAFFIPGIFSLCIAILLIPLLRDSPKSVGLPAPEAYKGEIIPDEDSRRITLKELGQIILCNPMLWYISMANMCLYIVRMGVITWAPTFLHEMKGTSLSQAGLQVAAYDIAGIVGGLTAGWMSDKLFRGRRGPVGAAYMLLLAIALFYFWKAPAGSGWENSIAMIFVGFLVYGPQVLIGVAAADLTSKRAVGVANGFSGTFAYVGVGISSLIIGWIADHYSWDYGFIFFIGAAILGAVFFALTGLHQTMTTKKKCT